MNDDTTPDFADYVNPEMRERLKELHQQSLNPTKAFQERIQELQSVTAAVAQELDAQHRKMLLDTQAKYALPTPAVTLTIPAYAAPTTPVPEYRPSDEKQLADAIRDLIEVLKKE